MGVNLDQTERDPVGLDLLGKADVIVRILESGKEHTVQQLAEASGEPVSSVYRLLTAMQEIGFVERGTQRGLYRLGLYFSRIGAVCDDRLSLRDTARPHLDRLRRETGATTFLMLKRGGEAVCVDRLVGTGVRVLAMRLGGALPLYRGGGPRALLANLHRSERESILSALEAEALTDPGTPSRSALDFEIARDRERGYSVSDGDVTPGVAALGAPVFNHRGELAAAISVSGVRAMVLTDVAAMAATVLDTAHAISRDMGYIATEEEGSSWPRRRAN